MASSSASAPACSLTISEWTSLDKRIQMCACSSLMRYYCMQTKCVTGLKLCTCKEGSHALRHG